MSLSATLALPQAAQATEATRENAGRLADGTRIEAIVLANSHGVTARILTYGATLQSLEVPGRNREVADVVLGYDEAADYERFPNFFGVTVGRYANRIAGARFTLDGREYRMPANDGANSLHGGGAGFDKVTWRVVSVEDGPVARVVLAYNSPAGDAGYPGNLDVRVTYSLDEQGALGITFDAVTDAPTVVNMTNHALFNMAGAGAPQGATDNVLTIPAAHYTPVDAGLIPTGELRAVAGTVFDFRAPRRIAQDLRGANDEQIRLGRGYDHNFALDKGVTRTPQLAARLTDPLSGRTLEVLTTEPGVQFYTGNFLDGTVVGRGHLSYRQGDGIALEPQKFPDAPNQPAFVSARVDPGQPYHHEMVYRVSCDCQ
ncbi:MAG: aldose epimerase family protein [Alteraurantiacibacter sp.]